MTIFKNILCVVDTKEDCAAALIRAISLAENNQADLTVVDVVDHFNAVVGTRIVGPNFVELDSKIATARAQALDALVEPHRATRPIKTKILSGTRYLEIVREVSSAKHDLVVKISDKMAWLDRLVGSDDMNLLRMCPCPVWLVKDEEKQPYKCILAAVDVDDNYPPKELETRHALNLQILETAASLALSEFAALHIVHTWEAPGVRTMRGASLRIPESEITAYIDQERNRHEACLDEVINRAVESLGRDRAEHIEPGRHLIEGWARKEIPALAKQIAADVIVMGTVARTGIPGFIMGNTAETILNQIDCCVLAIKPSGFKTPVANTD